MKNLFKRAAFFTDLHYGLRSNSEQHNRDCDAFIDWFIETAKADNCETCFFLGDWHHHRASINIQTLHYSLKGLEKLSANFENVYVIIGNHDMAFRHHRDVHSIEWGKHLSNVHLIDSLVTIDGVTLSPFLVNDEYQLLKDVRSKYLMSHLELPSFLMNAQIAMPDHGELQTNHISQFDLVFSGHFHKRQRKGNVIYIGNAFPHNFSDVNDDERGMMMLEWDCEPRFAAWPGAPRFRIYNLSDVLESPETLLLPNSHVKIHLDIDLSYEESAFIRETLMPQYSLRELKLIPQTIDIETDSTDYSNTTFESVDTIIQKQIDELLEGSYDKKLLLSIFNAL